jgi:DNA repair exonuclease SbcCD ATPase subunit
MHIQRIKLRNVMSHDATDIALPERGVVVVMGPNGAGKSSLIEAVAVAGWGKTLRGTPPWRRDLAGIIDISVDDLRIVRSCSAKGKVELSWSVDGAEGTAYETTTKAQDALARLIGPFDVWRRSSVFSSSDAAHFTLATDGERKRLLEAVLGVDCFDGALESCRGDLRAVGKRADEAKRASEMAETRLEAERRRVEDARKALEALAPPGELPPEGEPRTKAGKTLTDLYDLRASIEKDVERLRSRLRALDAAGGAYAQKESAIKATLAKLDGDACPTCDQAIPEELRGRLRTEAGEAGERARAEQEGAKTARGALERDIAELESEVAAINEQRAALTAQAKVADQARAEAARYAKQRAHQEGVISSSAGVIESLEREAERARKAEADGDRELAELVACERVLGLKGVRATVLGRALSGIEQVTNAWLTRLRRAHLSVKLAPYSEKKSGGTTDAISLTVEGAGEGYGYRATSNGERRRLDVAILFALAEVTGAARGRAAGTMFFDEVFDALDADGIDAVSDALAELARDRAVVIITHNPALAARLDARLRLRIDGGKVS